MGTQAGNPPPVPVRSRCTAGLPNAAGWVLGALDPDDAEFFADHLLTCGDCRRAVAELEPAGQLLGMGAPASLRATTLARVRQAASQR
jgi:putative zinc finger protein